MKETKIPKSNIRKVYLLFFFSHLIKGIFNLKELLTLVKEAENKR